MIVRQSKFSIPRKHLYNAGVIGFLFITAMLAIKSAFIKDDTPSCEARYTGGVLFSLARRTGEPLTPEDLQSRLGGHDWGLLENTRIVPSQSAPSGFALEIDLKAKKVKGAGDDDDSASAKSGMGFTWFPKALETATAACLTYSVWTPTDFVAGTGGLLPGLLGDRPEDAGNADAPRQTFGTKMAWLPNANLVAAPTNTVGDRTRYIDLDAGKAVLAPGRWVRIDQEMVLNTAGQTDGILRVWVDGKLRLERDDIGYRNRRSQRFVGVVGDVHFVKPGLGYVPAPKDTRLRLSPIELRVQSP